MVAGKEGGEKGVNVLGCTCRKRLERCASCNCKINGPAAAAGNELMVKREVGKKKRVGNWAWSGV